MAASSVAIDAILKHLELCLCMFAAVAARKSGSLFTLRCQRSRHGRPTSQIIHSACVDDLSAESMNGCSVSVREAKNGPNFKFSCGELSQIRFLFLWNTLGEHVFRMLNRTPIRSGCSGNDDETASSPSIKPPHRCPGSVGRSGAIALEFSVVTSRHPMHRRVSVVWSRETASSQPRLYLV